MDWLRREIAPLSSRVWEAIDDAVLTAARHAMAARRIADFQGPRGWDHIAVRCGTMRSLPSARGSHATLLVPDVILLTEIRAAFSLPWGAVEAFERGGPVLDTHDAEEAAREVARAEDRITFYGDKSQPGFLSYRESPHFTLGDWNQPGQAESEVLAAVAKLDANGVPGPYAMVLDADRYFVYQRATSQGGGYPAARQLKSVVGTVVRSHVIQGGALFSTRGEDFHMVVGGDLAVGYRWHDEKAVHLFCAESVAAQVLTPEAVCVLDHGGKK